MNRLRRFLLHMGVICSYVCIAAKVLDWYNPYMDFTGHIWFIQLALYFTVILRAFLKRPQKRSLYAPGRRPPHKTGNKELPRVFVSISGGCADGRTRQKKYRE